jgi:alpha-methylacyl-CoA racemase
MARKNTHFDKQIASRSGKHAGEKPLRGLRILTLSLNAPGPLAASRLAKLGADVIKIEPLEGDPLDRRFCPKWYKALIRNQRITRLDLKNQRDRLRLDSFLRHTDLLLTSTRLSSLRRLSLHWKALHSKFPALSHIALLGSPAPRHEIAGHDLTYQARLGLLAPPNMPPTLWADLAGAESVVRNALIILLTKRSGSRGIFRPVTIEEAIMEFTAPLYYGLTRAGGVLGGGLAQYNLYRAQDSWVAVAALEAHFAARLKTELGISKLTHESLSAAFRTRRATEWERWAIKRDLPICRVRSPRSQMSQ